MTVAIAKQEAKPQTLAPWLTEEQQKIVRDSILSGATKEEADVLMEVAKSLRLNPLLKQIHFVKRWDSRKKCEVWAFQVGIDGFRLIADRTGEYDGQDDAEFLEDKAGTPTLCKVRVYRKGIPRPFVGFAYWSEYVQLTKDGSVNSMWARGKHFMLAKCAEAVALRKAFPADLSGVYIPEEFAAEEKELNPPPAKPTSRTEAVKAAIKARVVDVQPGETEGEAEARLSGGEPEPGSDIEPPPPLDEHERGAAPEVDPVVPFKNGVSAGKRASQLDDKGLIWVIGRIRDGLPTAGQYRAKNEAQLAQFEEHARFRGLTP